VGGAVVEGGKEGTGFGEGLDQVLDTAVGTVTGTVARGNARTMLSPAEGAETGRTAVPQAQHRMNTAVPKSTPRRRTTHGHPRP